MHIAGKENLLKSQSSKNTKQGSSDGKYLFSFQGGCLKTKEIFFQACFPTIYIRRIKMNYNKV